MGEEHLHTLYSTWDLLKTLEHLEDHDSVRSLLVNTALGRLPAVPDESLPADLRAKKPEIASICEALGLTTPPQEAR